MEVIIGIILLIVLLVVIWGIFISNKLNILQVKIDEADSGINVALTKRYDVLTKMVEVVKVYAIHEKETLFEVIKLRKGMSLEDKNEVSEKMNRNMEKINIIAESYPELKSNENFKTLQQSIVEVEEHLQAVRRLDNSNVSAFNQMIVTFPASIVANSKSLNSKPFFEVEELRKSDVKIDL